MKFSYQMPVKVIMGKGCVRQNADLFNKGWKKALIVTGKFSAKKNGAQDDVCHALSECGIQWEIFDDVEPNPSVVNVRNGAKAAIEVCADVIVGIGGGSPMDAAKAIAFLATNLVDDETLFKGAFETRPLPVIAVPTTAGTGSEVTQYSIITVPEEKTKKNLCHSALFPEIAFLDASYMEKLPHDITINTAIDAFSHAVESYLSKRSCSMSSIVALESMAVTCSCFETLRKHETIPFEIREKLLFGSMLGGVAISQTGTTAVHAMGYSLTCSDNIDHGRANGLLLCESLKFVYQQNSEKIDKIISVTGFKDINLLEVLFQAMIGRYNILSDDDIRHYTDLAIKAKSITNSVPQPDYDDVFGIYKRSVGII